MGKGLFRRREKNAVGGPFLCGECNDCHDTLNGLLIHIRDCHNHTHILCEVETCSEVIFKRAKHMHVHKVNYPLLKHSKTKAKATVSKEDHGVSKEEDQGVRNEDQGLDP